MVEKRLERAGLKWKASREGGDGRWGGGWWPPHGRGGEGRVAECRVVIVRNSGARDGDGVLGALRRGASNRKSPAQAAIERDSRQFRRPLLCGAVARGNGCSEQMLAGRVRRMVWAYLVL